MPDPADHPVHQPSVVALTGPLAALGRAAAGGLNLDQLLHRACVEVARALRVEYAKVLQLMPDTDELLVRAGCGWGPEVVGVARLGADIASPAGYALKTGLPTISNDLTTEQRFVVPELLRRHGVVSAVNVIIRTESMVFGVLEADSRHPGQFNDADTQFLQAYANILALAIAQHQLAEENRSLSDYAALLLQEFRHRTKNTQQMLFSLLSMKRQGPAGSAEDRMLDSILSYLQTLNRLDEMLIAAGPMRQINLTEYLGDVADSLLRPHRHDTSRISLAVSDQPVITSGDQAQKLGLILAEFIINSIKYGSDAEGARISVVLSQHDGQGCLELRDGGPGIPPDVTPGTGMRIIAALGKALRGEVDWSSEQGARLLVRFPVAAENGPPG